MKKMRKETETDKEQRRTWRGKVENIIQFGEKKKEKNRQRH